MTSGGILGVKHFYLRGNVEVKSGEHQLFQGSTIDEIVWDEVAGKFDEGFITGRFSLLLIDINAFISFKSISVFIIF